MSKVDTFFSPEQEQQIVQAIKEAEKQTSGEIRVHIEEGNAQDDPMKRAITVFNKLKMSATELRNGVLFYLDVTNKKFAIIGDKGIDDVVSNNFWDETKKIVLRLFEQGNPTEGLAQGILKAGKVLQKHFPYQTDDTNELTDEISKNI